MLTMVSKGDVRVLGMGGRSIGQGIRMWMRMQRDGCGMSAAVVHLAWAQVRARAWVSLHAIWKAAGELPIQFEDGVGVIVDGQSMHAPYQVFEHGWWGWL